VSLLKTTVKTKEDSAPSVRYDYLNGDLNAPIITKKPAPILALVSKKSTQNTIQIANTVSSHLANTTNTPQSTRRLLKKRIAGGVCLLFSLIGARYFWATHTPITYTHTPLPVVLKPAETTPNALHFYNQIASNFDENNPARYLLCELDLDTLEKCQEAVTFNTENLRLLRSGLKQEGMSYVLGTKNAWFQTGNPKITHDVIARSMGHLLWAEAQVKAAKGDYLGAVYSGLDAVDFSTDTYTDETLSGMIGASAIREIGLDTIALYAKHLTPAQSQEVLTRLVAFEKKFPDFKRSSLHEEEEVKRMLEGFTPEIAIEWQAKQDIVGTNPPFTWLPVAQTYVSTAGLLLWKGREGILNEMHQEEREYQKRLAFPYQKAVKLPATQSSKFSVRNNAIYFSVAQKQAKMQVLKAQLALAIYGGEHHRQNPNSLADLVQAGYLEALPLDPLSENSDTPLPYNKKNGKIWSVGKNGINEQGGGDDNLKGW
jgi:hypothetical protein